MSVALSAQAGDVPNAALALTIGAIDVICATPFRWTMFPFSVRSAVLASSFMARTTPVPPAWLSRVQTFALQDSTIASQLPENADPRLKFARVTAPDRAITPDPVLNVKTLLPVGALDVPPLTRMS